VICERGMSNQTQEEKGEVCIEGKETAGNWRTDFQRNRESGPSGEGPPAGRGIWVQIRGGREICVRKRIDTTMGQ